MKNFTVLLCAALLAGCAGSHPKDTARHDAYDSVQIEQMVGNNVSQAVLAKTIVCLNARRETRRVTALTNTLVTAVTNQAVTAITNQTISFSTNLLYTTMTSLSPATPPPVVVLAGEAVAVDTNAPGVLPSHNAPTGSTNLTVSVASNSSGSRAPNQTTANSQVTRTLNQQLTTTTNNFSVAVMTNLVFTGETNFVISFVTNTTVVAVTNILITPTNGVAYDYFLFTELIPPADFTLQQQGETLVLLVDGVRHGCVPGQSGTAFVSRKGYTSTLYRVSPEVLVAIANAKEVRLRLKGVNNTIERTLSTGSRNNFRSFLGRYFTPAPASGKSVVVLEDTTTHVAHR